MHAPIATPPPEFAPRMTSRAGAYECWHVGPNRYEVRHAGDVLAWRQHRSEAFAECCRLYDLANGGGL
jgi:hypothetical protein